MLKIYTIVFKIHTVTTKARSKKAKQVASVSMTIAKIIIKLE